MSKIDKILIVGLGSIGLRHLKILSNLYEKADIRVFRHRKSKVKIKLFRNKVIYNFNEILQFHPQIAVICSPAPFHINMATKLAKMGCHLFIEKPLSINSKNIDKLLYLRNYHNLISHVGYNLRFDSSLNKYREFIHSQIIGEVYSIRIEVGNYLPKWRPNKYYRDTVSSQKKLGGGVLLELSHEIDYLQWIFGKITNIRANLKKHSQLQIDVEDTAYLNANIKSKLTNCYITANLILDFIRHDPQRSCTAIGEKGSLKWDALKGTVYLWGSKNKIWKLLFKRGKKDNDITYKRQWRYFFSKVKSNTQSEISIEDGLSVLKVIEAARSSDKKMGKVEMITNA